MNITKFQILHCPEREVSTIVRTGVERNIIGLGPSAHSFDGTSRQWNVANNALYIQALNDDKVPFEQETLSDSQRFNEYIMTSLQNDGRH